MELLERRNLLLKASDNPRLQTLLLEQCRRDIRFWFNTFCWTMDPRREDMAFIPFNLYPFQEWFVEELYGSIRTQEDLGIEKCRDIGASWMVIEVFQYCWLFHEGWHFHVGSRKRDEVDKADDDPSTLFGKFRTNWRMLPSWMRPPITKSTNKMLTLKNEFNNNFVTGESANPGFARGPRKRGVFLDEFAFWPDQAAVWKSCSQTTRSRIVSSTPDGPSNKYADLMQDDRNSLVQWPGLDDEMRRKGLILPA